MAKRNLTLSERFWLKVNKTETCWLWTAHLSWKGYGVFHMPTTPTKSRTHYAHRVAWSLTHGDIPEGLEILHQCDTPVCVNPAHMKLGTHAENMAESRLRGRHPLGTARKNHKLNEEIVKAIRQKRLDGWTQYKIMREFGISRGVTIRVIKRQTWKHVE